MSDTTTPKRNEAVARWHMRLNPISGNVYIANEKPAKDLSTEYVLLSDYEALQGEVSRLREALDRLVLAADSAAHSCNTALMDQAIDLARDALNLEPPTDGR